jgi:hypothetical protein
MTITITGSEVTEMGKPVTAVLRLEVEELKKIIAEHVAAKYGFPVPPFNLVSFQYKSDYDSQELDGATVPVRVKIGRSE